MDRLDKRLPILAAFLLIVTACTRLATAPGPQPASGPAPAPDSTPDEIRACVARNTRPIAVAGIEIGKSSADVRANRDAISDPG